jgi:hypothetical protein
VEEVVFAEMEGWFVLRMSGLLVSGHGYAEYDYDSVRRGK